MEKSFKEKCWICNEMVNRSELYSHYMTAHSQPGWRPPNVPNMPFTYTSNNTAQIPEFLTRKDYERLQERLERAEEDIARLKRLHEGL